MSILLIDPHFRSFSGHYNRYARVVASEAAKHGLTVQVAASQEIDPEARSLLRQGGIDVAPVFPRVGYRLSLNRALQMHTTGVILECALRHLDRNRSDTVAWLSGIPSLVEAAALFARETRLSVPFQFLDFARDWVGRPKGAPLIIKRSLRRGADAGMKLYAQTPYLASIASEECEIDFRPFPAILDYGKLPDMANRRDKPRVGLMNMMMRHKSIGDVARALSVVSKEVSIVLHTGNTDRPETRADVDQIAGLGAEMHEGSLPPAEYNRVWSTLDATILSYDTVKYQRQCSGMMFESLSDGIVPIVPDHTSMAATARDAGIGIVYDADDPSALERALRRLVDEWQSLREAAREFAPIWRQANSPERVLHILEQAWGERETIPDGVAPAGQS